MIGRREFITLLGGAAAWPLSARAQQAERVRRIGVLMGYPENDLEGPAFLAAFREALQKLGWAEDRNIRFDTRWATPEDAEARQRFAKELVALQPDLILSAVTPTTSALLQQTRTIPIVFATVSDPVGTRASRSRAATSPVSRLWWARWRASGWNCSRRLRRELPESRCCSTRPWRHMPSLS
jgi:putative tryptophan/tyrosine transport system substrate-binding protein